MPWRGHGIWNIRRTRAEKEHHADANKRAAGRREPTRSADDEMVRRLEQWKNLTPEERARWRWRAKDKDRKGEG